MLHNARKNQECEDGSRLHWEYLDAPEFARAFYLREWQSHLRSCGDCRSWLNENRSGPPMPDLTPAEIEAI